MTRAKPGMGEQIQKGHAVHPMPTRTRRLQEELLFSPMSLIHKGGVANLGHGVVSMSDGVRTLQFLFLGGPSLPEPRTEPGLDPTGDSLAGF